MNIYVTHATCFDYVQELYLPLRQSTLNHQHIITLPHEKNHEPLNSKQVIQSSDLVIAEVSYPSTGQGIELGWADIYSVPIICFYKKGARFSSSLRIVTNHLYEYLGNESLIDQITLRLKEII